ncbi:MAG: hypothetical protein DDT37_01593 [Firmicutes bacterium]|nr:hypothetical protein [candidate division NPL-UPA2 bacterium]
MAESGGCVLARHEERIKNLEADFGEMKSCLRKIHGLLMTLAGGMITSLILLVINLAAGR